MNDSIMWEIRRLLADQLADDFNKEMNKTGKGETMKEFDYEAYKTERNYLHNLAEGAVASGVKESFESLTTAISDSVHTSFQRKLDLEKSEDQVDRWKAVVKAFVSMVARGQTEKKAFGDSLLAMRKSDLNAFEKAMSQWDIAFLKQ